MKLTNEQIKLLKDVDGGADIFEHCDAVRYRELEKLGFVHVCKAMGSYHGAMRLPVFGAILTSKGKQQLVIRK